jgi:amidase
VSTTSSQPETAFAGPAALAALVHAREATPRELVELYLRRIEALDPSLNAFRVTLAEQALAEADELDGDRLAGPLAGVPIAVKDDIALAGQVATKGTRVLSGAAPAAADAEPLRRLRAAGAIPIGITNVPELMIFPWTATAAHGITRNPWDPLRTPGGSSGGSAAAVAAGLAPAATASDGGGSIRIPAACCGLVGMKPSRGRVSAAPGRPGWLGLSTYGALARTVADSALLLDVIHGAAAGDDPALPRFDGSYVDAAGTPPRPLRIATSTKAPPVALTSLRAAQRAVHEGTARLLEQLGHHVSERDPDYGTAQLQFTQTWVRGIYEEAARTGRRGELERSTRQMAAAGRYLVPPPRRRRLLRARPLTTRRITALWDEFDVLMTPALASAPIAAEGGYGRGALVAVDIAARMTPFTSVFNLTGQPAITVPIGVDGDGLPTAVQLVGRVGAEDVLYSLAGQLERAAPWAQRRPGIS